MRIRLANLEDVDQLHQVFHQSWKAFHEKYRKEFKEEASSSTKYRIVAYDYYVIVDDHEIIGGIEIRREKYDVYRLHRMFIRPDRQGEGIGRHVVREIEKKYPECKTWKTDTPEFAESNHHFYESLGYKEVGNEKVDTISLKIYEKQLED